MNRKFLHFVMSIVGAVCASPLVVTPARADSDQGNTTANVSVTGAITLTALTNAFTLSGIPGAVVEEIGAVTMHVTTNNFAGYAVTVEPVVASLTGAIAGNTDVIPTSDLNVKLTGTAVYDPLTFGTPLEVYRKTAASAPTGDEVSNDYSITIPFVQPDIYSGDLEYVATTL